MAKIEITLNEYIRYQKVVKSSDRSPFWFRVIFYTVFIFSLFEAFYHRLYILGFFLILWFGFAYLSRKRFVGKLYHTRLYEQNKFLNGTVDLALSPRLMKISAGLNHLKFAAYDVYFIKEFSEFYYIENHSGFKLFLPKKCLNDEEKNIIKEFNDQAIKKRKKWWGY